MSPSLLTIARILFASTTAAAVLALALAVWQPSALHLSASDTDAPQSAPLREVEGVVIGVQVTQGSHVLLQLANDERDYYVRHGLERGLDAESLGAGLVGQPARLFVVDDPAPEPWLDGEDEADPATDDAAPPADSLGRIEVADSVLFSAW